MPTRKSKTKVIGLLTSGGDCPGLNAAIRAVARTAIQKYGMKVIGVLDGFRGLVENRTIQLDDRAVSGILAQGGTILGTSRDKPQKMPMGGRVLDMTETAIENARKMPLDCLVCLGGGGTQKNAFRLSSKGGLPVMTLPKTIDNDVAETDVTFGYDTAMNIASEAIDRLHTTATSHHRIIVCEVMGHKAGWLALGAGIAGGADVVLIPELPYDLSLVADYLMERRRNGKRFSIVAVAEGSRSRQEVQAQEQAEKEKSGKSAKKTSGKKSGKSAKSGKKATKPGVSNGPNGELVIDPAELPKDESRDGMPLVVQRVEGQVITYHAVQEPIASRVARGLQELTGTEARVTSLGHVQRGGPPSTFDRVLCTLLGARAADLLAEGVYNVMVGYRGGMAEPVPLEQVAGKRKTVPPDHPMIEAARSVGTCLGI
jgi:6-phosphofructokinase 1